jgi:hypothetical protein
VSGEQLGAKARQPGHLALLGLRLHVNAVNGPRRRGPALPARCGPGQPAALYSGVAAVYVASQVSRGRSRSQVR